MKAEKGGKRKTHLDQVFLQRPAHELLIRDTLRPLEHPPFVLVPLVAAEAKEVSSPVMRRKRKGRFASPQPDQLPLDVALDMLESSERAEKRRVGLRDEER